MARERAVGGLEQRVGVDLELGDAARDQQRRDRRALGDHAAVVLLQHHLRVGRVVGLELLRQLGLGRLVERGPGQAAAALRELRAAEPRPATTRAQVQLGAALRALDVDLERRGRRVFDRLLLVEVDRQLDRRIVDRDQERPEAARAHLHVGAVLGADDVDALGQHRPAVAGDRRRVVALRVAGARQEPCLLYTSPSPRDRTRSRMPSSA